jgi:hypothetical protein
MNKGTIDTVVDGFLVTVMKDGERSAGKFFYQGVESEVLERVYKTFPEGPYTTKFEPAKRLSPGVYCIENKS